MSSTPIRKSGRLELIIGPMFAGKTSELTRRINRFKLSNYNCLVVKFDGDTRYGKDEIITHDGKRMTAVKCHYLLNCSVDPAGFDVIGIDEGQFFPDIMPFCSEQIKNRKIIIVAGLDATYLRTGFENMLYLVPLATSIKKLSAICMSCGKNASFSRRISHEEKIQVIGGVDKYMALCRVCYKLPAPEKRTPFKASGAQIFSSVSNIKFNQTCKRQLLVDES